MVKLADSNFPLVPAQVINDCPRFKARSNGCTCKVPCTRLPGHTKSTLRPTFCFPVLGSGQGLGFVWERTGEINFACYTMLRRPHRQCRSQRLPLEARPTHPSVELLELLKLALKESLALKKLGHQRRGTSPGVSPQGPKQCFPKERQVKSQESRILKSRRVLNMPPNEVGSAHTRSDHRTTLALREWVEILWPSVPCVAGLTEISLPSQEHTCCTCSS